MTLEELEEQLPNGLHDAQMRSIMRNFECETLDLDVGILVGLPSEPPPERDQYRDARITFTGVKYFVVEGPDVQSAFLAPGNVWFTVSRSQAGLFSSEIEKKLAPLTLKYSFFIQSWLSSVHVVASDVSLAWTSERPAGAYK